MNVGIEPGSLDGLAGQSVAVYLRLAPNGDTMGIIRQGLRLSQLGQLTGLPAIEITTPATLRAWPTPVTQQFIRAIQALRYQGLQLARMALVTDLEPEGLLLPVVHSLLEYELGKPAALVLLSPDWKASKGRLAGRRVSLAGLPPGWVQCSSAEATLDLGEFLASEMPPNKLAQSA